MAAPAVPIDVDAGTGAWTTDGMAMIYMPRHFFVGNHQAVETALGAARHAELLHEAGHAAAFTWCEEAARAGGLAGLGGSLEVIGVHHTLYAQFSPGYGFDGIAVALLARNNPLGVIPAAFLFGALRTADRWLQLIAGVPRDIVIIIQAIAVLGVGLQTALNRRRTSISA